MCITDKIKIMKNLTFLLLLFSISLSAQYDTLWVTLMSDPPQQSYLLQLKPEYQHPYSPGIDTFSFFGKNAALPGKGFENNDKVYNIDNYTLNIDSTFLSDLNYPISGRGNNLEVIGGEGVIVGMDQITSSGTITISSINTIKDTIKVEILLSIDGALKVVNGYDVRKHMGTSFITYDGSGNQFEDIRYEHEVYLDENKKPLNKNYTIWQTIRK